MPRCAHKNWPNQIRRFREERDLRLRDVARLIGCPDHFHLSYWEKGRVAPNLRYLLGLSAVTGRPIEVLYADEFRKIREEVQERMERLGIRPRIV